MWRATTTLPAQTLKRLSNNHFCYRQKRASSFCLISTPLHALIPRLCLLSNEDVTPHSYASVRPFLHQAVRHSAHPFIHPTRRLVRWSPCDIFTFFLVLRMVFASPPLLLRTRIILPISPSSLILVSRSVKGTKKSHPRLLLLIKHSLLVDSCLFWILCIERL